MKSATRPLGWYHGWNIVAACIVSQVCANGLTYNSFSLFLRDWSAQLHAPISQLQLTIFCMVTLSAFLSPWVGALSDKYPARWLFASGLLGMAVFYLAISVTTAAWQLLALYGLLAPVALTLCTAIPCNALISRWFVRRLGLALGLSSFGIGMAGVLLPPLIAAILPAVGWRMIWRGGGLLLAVIITPLVVLVLRNRPTERDGQSYLTGDGRAAKPHAHAAGAGQFSWRAVIARKNFWLLVAIYLPMMGLYGGCAQNLAPFAASHGLGQQSAGVLLSVLSLSHVVGTLVLGLLSDRFGNRLPFAGLAVVMLLGATLLAFGGGLPIISVGSALIGAGGGVFTLLGAATAVEFGAEGFGRAFGLAMLFLPVMALSPFFVARMQESTGSYVPALAVLSALVVMSGALSLLLRERGRGQPTAQAALDGLKAAPGAGNVP